MRSFPWAAALLAVLLVGCAPVAPRPPEKPQRGPFTRGTYEEASRAVGFRVLRPSYLPPGAQLREIDYAARPNEQWAVMRYTIPQGLVYVAAEPASPEGLQVSRDAEVTIQGLPAIVTGLRRPDGGVAEWRVFWRRGDVLYVVGGDLPAEELVAVAAGLR